MVKLRGIICAGLVCTTIALGSPARAADDRDTANDGAPAEAARSAPLQIAAEPAIEIQTRIALARAGSNPALFAPVPKKILSQGAKTAIIVGSIVGGVLIIVGVIAFGRPGKWGWWD